MRYIYRAALGLLILFGAAPALGHDFWIEPSTFRPAADSVVRIGLRVGEKFNGEAVARDSGKIDRFLMVGGAGERPVVERDGANPAGMARVEAPGLYVIGYRSKATRIELEASKFEAYLREEGLGHVIQSRAERGERGKSGREIYSRCAKALLSAGDGGPEGFDRILGFRLELVPERNPYRSTAGDEFVLRVLFEGQPLAGVLVSAMNKSEPDQPLTARSDEQGRVHFALQRTGTWLITAVHMVRAQEGSDADWESLWASLTFESPGR